MPDLADVTVPLDAIVFDSDGVLVASEATIAQAWATWARSRGLDPDEVNAFAPGQRSAAVVARFCAEPEWATALDEIERTELEDEAPMAAIPGALALTAALPPDRWGVVTSGSPALSGKRLAAAGFPRPPFVITAHDVSEGKPDPEGYLLAIARLGVPAERVAVLEDSTAGIHAALASGAGVVIGVGDVAVSTDAPVVVRDLTALAWTGDGPSVRGVDRLR